ncbi:MAG: hypothetical protein M1834_005883 [Cirrosporium novae-zelandiae]|nr:MAG: hypothetical protein M1834_005883 [Cirrosporium novae-zelandiae]
MAPATPATPASMSHNSSTTTLFPPNGVSSSSWINLGTTPNRTPDSVASSNNTYLMPTSPVKGRQLSPDSLRPKLAQTTGQKPAALVNASLTYAGNDQIYAFGGFDQYTDEVYNHVLRLDLKTFQWTLVDNYGDIPGVRMGHTACLYQGDKLLVHGGENEHREYLSDLVVLDLKTAHWTQPELKGPTPKGRARHAATIYDDKLFIVGGLTGGETNYILDEICYLDLKTWTWSRSWSFVGRYDHSIWVWENRLWVFGGLSYNMERGGEVWWLDLKGIPTFETAQSGELSRINENRAVQRSGFNQSQQITTGTSGYAANSTSIQVRAAALAPRPIVPGTVSSLKFVSGPDVPCQTSGTHFHVYSSGTLVDFVTPAPTIRPWQCNLSSLELDTLRWQKLAEGVEIFDPNYRWQYCTVNEDGTKAWLLGCRTITDQPEVANGVSEEYLSDIMSIDLRKFGLLGNKMAAEVRFERSKSQVLDRTIHRPICGLGADLASMFDQPPESGSLSDFVITAARDDIDFTEDEDMISTSSQLTQHDNTLTESPSSVPIHVHLFILRSRWPHFRRAYATQMAEYHTKKMHIPEPYSVVRAFLYYLYTDSIAYHSQYCKSLTDVAGMLVLSNCYDMPKLRVLCVNRLTRELDVENAAVVWERAGIAGEEWLKKRAASFCLLHWGRIVRTEGFRRMDRKSLMDLCEVVDVEGRVVGGEELEYVGGLGGGKLGIGGIGGLGARTRLGSISGGTVVGGDDTEEADGDEDEGMDIN